MSFLQSIEIFSGKKAQSIESGVFTIFRIAASVLSSFADSDSNGVFPLTK
jgi:hypothetical protein